MKNSHDVEHAGPVLGVAHKSGGVKPVSYFPPLPT